MSVKDKAELYFSVHGKLPPPTEPANLKSKAEAIQRMLSGERFLWKCEIIWYLEHPLQNHPAFGGIPFNNLRAETWNHYKEWEVIKDTP